MPRIGVPKQRVVDHHAEGSSQNASEASLKVSSVSCMCQPWLLPTAEVNIAVMLEWGCLGTAGWQLTVSFPVGRRG